MSTDQFACNRHVIEVDKYQPSPIFIEGLTKYRYTGRTESSRTGTMFPAQCESNLFAMQRTLLSLKLDADRKHVILGIGHVFACLDRQPRFVEVETMNL